MKKDHVLVIFIVLLVGLRSLVLYACDPESARSPWTGAWGTGADPFSAVLNASEWNFPQSVEGISGWNSDCKPSLTAEGRLLCFQSDAGIGPPYHPDHMGTGTNIYVAERDDDGWGRPAPLDSAASWSGTYPFISSDGSRILFQRTVYGNADIFVTVRNGDRWMPAAGIGPAINTKEYNECYPSLSFDGQTLYFASDRPRNSGDGTCGHRNGTERTGIRRSIWVRRQQAQCHELESLRHCGRDETLFFQGTLFALHHAGTVGLGLDRIGMGRGGKCRSAGQRLHAHVFRVSDTRQPDIVPGREVSEGGYGGAGHLERGPDLDYRYASDSGGDSQDWENTAELDSAIFIHRLIETKNGTLFAGTGPYGRYFDL